MKVKSCLKKTSQLEAVAELAGLAGRHADAHSGSLSIKNNKAEAWLTTQQAADYLGISVGSLRNRVSCGEIPRRKLGRLNRYLRSELDALLVSKMSKE
jgi:excisionase family DNA binding protein